MFSTLFEVRKEIQKIIYSYAIFIWHMWSQRSQNSIKSEQKFQRDLETISAGSLTIHTFMEQRFELLDV